jgi:hypothetical protein
VWRVRNAVHTQVAADLAMRDTDPQWQRRKHEIGNYAWTRVYERIGDPGYTYYGHEDNARESDGLVQENLKPWADAMMEGQFSASTMAQLDALDLLTELDSHRFRACSGSRRTAVGGGPTPPAWWPLSARPRFRRTGDDEIPRRLAGRLRVDR